MDDQHFPLTRSDFISLYYLQHGYLPGRSQSAWQLLLFIQSKESDKNIWKETNFWCFSIAPLLPLPTTAAVLRYFIVHTVVDLLVSLEHTLACYCPQAWLISRSCVLQGVFSLIQPILLGASPSHWSEVMLTCSLLSSFFKVSHHPWHHGSNFTGLRSMASMASGVIFVCSRNRVHMPLKCQILTRHFIWTFAMYCSCTRRGRWCFYHELQVDCWCVWCFLPYVMVWCLQIACYWL